MVNIHTRNALLRFDPSRHHRDAYTPLSESRGAGRDIGTNATVPNPSRCNHQH
jgi:hypothetical protein